MLEDGYEVKFEKGVVNVGSSQPVLVKYVKLNQYDPNYETVRRSVIISLKSQLATTFSKESKLIELKKFINFEEVDIDSIRLIIAKDLKLREVSLEYDEILKTTSLLKNLKLCLNIQSQIKTLLLTKEYPNVCIMLARVSVLKPHSADVERLISINNSFKTSNRTNISLQHKNEILYINYNMPVLEKFDPRPAVELFAETNRRERETPLAKNQKWFQGIFEI